MLLSTLSCKLGRSQMIPRTLFQRTLIIRVSIDNTNTSASGFVFIVASFLFFLSFSVHVDIFSIHFIRLFGFKIPLISRLFVELCPNALSCYKPFSFHTYTNNRTDIHVLLPDDDWCLQSKNACVTVIKKRLKVNMKVWWIYYLFSFRLLPLKLPCPQTDTRLLFIKGHT